MGGAAGQRPPGGREVLRGSQEKASAFNVSQAWSAQSQLSAVASPGAEPTTGIPVRWFAEGGRSGYGGAGESRRTRKVQNKAVVSVRSWLLTRPTGSTSLSGGRRWGVGCRGELPLLSLVMAAVCHVGGKGGEVGGGERQAITKGGGFHLTKDASNQRGWGVSCGPLAANTASGGGALGGTSATFTLLTTCLSAKNFSILLIFSPS